VLFFYGNVLMVCIISETCVQDLLQSLIAQPMSPLQNLEAKQALAKQFAEILHFTLKFDDLKVNCNSILG